jgi:exosortase
LASFSFHTDPYAYTGVIPLLSAGLIYLERKRVFCNVEYGFGSGAGLLLFALAPVWRSIRHLGWLNPNDPLSLITFSIVVLWMGPFVLCDGTKAFEAATFQVLLFLLMVPLPRFLSERAILILRSGSVQGARVLSRLAGFPVFQDGFGFSLPGIDEETAVQCSGARSGVALLVTSVLMGHIFLQSPWNKFCLIPAEFPVAVFKDGLRIVIIPWLAGHPNQGFLTVWVHRRGGIPFSFLGPWVLAVLVTSLRQSDGIAQNGHNG